MIESIRNLKVSEIELRQRLPEPECRWLVGELRAHPSVAGARCAGEERRLTVEYDADRLGSDDLVDWLGDCGVRVAGVHASHA